MCKLLCTLATGSNADGFCSSSDPVVWLCSGGWGLVSFIALIVWLRWEGIHSSVPITKLPDPVEVYDASAASRADK
jgi:hypothetical protein